MMKIKRREGRNWRGRAVGTGLEWWRQAGRKEVVASRQTAGWNAACVKLSGLRSGAKNVATGITPNASRASTGRTRGRFGARTECLEETNRRGGVGAAGPMLAVQSGSLGLGVGLACAEQLPPRYPNSSPGAADLAVHSGGGGSNGGDGGGGRGFWPDVGRGFLTQSSGRMGSPSGVGGAGRLTRRY